MIEFLVSAVAVGMITLGLILLATVGMLVIDIFKELKDNNK